MADNVIEAAARAIRILGEGALGSSAAELARLAGIDGVPRNGLRVALSQVDRARRSQGVLHILMEATALEGKLGVDLDSFRSRVSDLARACGELMETADDTEEVQRTAAGLEEERAAGPRWW